MKPDSVSLNGKNLGVIPLIEGEEQLKEIDLACNKISAVENLVSMPQLQRINLSNN